jgi:hypothetical protein
MLVVSDGGQLWRFLVTSAVGPGLWTEERTDEGKLVKYESRQLGGFYGRRPPRRIIKTVSRKWQVIVAAGTVGCRVCVGDE